VTSPRAVARGLVFFLLLVSSVAVLARPSIPSSDATVLEHVPAAAATEQLRSLREKVTADPEDLQSAVALAKGYLEIGRQNADPRFTSYAQATLAPWLSRPTPSSDVLVLSATALQSLHQFNEALTLLNRALAATPDNPQAWLTKATILQVQGQFDDARKACAQLSRTAGHLIAFACVAGVNSLTGRLAPSYTALSTIYVDDERLPPGIRTWVLGQLAEMSVRMGDAPAAERYFRSALRVAPEDVYLKSDYADLLLSQGRAAEVVALLRNNEPQDNLLLRLAIAGKKLRSADGKRWADLFEARYQAARRDGDFTHLLEQARFALEVKENSAEALQLAAQNWQVQKEPADVRIYIAAADAARDAPARSRITQWTQAVHYEDRTLEMKSSNEVARR